MTNEYVTSNRALWNEWTAIHEKSEFYDLESFKAGGVRLRDFEIEEVGDVSGKDLLHLQCHFGVDSLSWARLGANVTGADFSEAAVTLATSLAAELDLDARFVHSDVYELPNNLDGDFDMIYTSRGVLGWLPDIDRWAEVIGHFLRPGGTFYITEMHPVAWAFDDDEGVSELSLRYPYFTHPEPLAFPTQGSYADPDAHVETPVEYGWNHGLGEIVTAIASQGLRIELLHEFPFAEWSLPFLEARDDGTWRLPASQKGELPLSYSLRARNSSTD